MSDQGGSLGVVQDVHGKVLHRQTKMYDRFFGVFAEISFQANGDDSLLCFLLEGNGQSRRILKTINAIVFLGDDGAILKDGAIVKGAHWRDGAVGSHGVENSRHSNNGYPEKYQR